MSFESFEQSCLQIALQLKIPGIADKGVDIKRLLKEYLDNDRTGPWFVVYDNSDDIDMWTSASKMVNGVEKRKQRLMDYLPKGEQGRIIFTTRNRKAAVAFASSNVITVPEMTESVAATLLNASLIEPDTGQGPGVSKLLAMLTYIPLAIVQASAYINANGITVLDYVCLLDQKEEEIIDILSEDYEDEGRYQEIKNPIATTWLISFEQIKRFNAMAAECLAFIACISPRRIPVSILPLGQSKKQEIDAIGILKAYAFVTQDPASNSLDLHRLVHLTARNWLRDQSLLHQWTATTISRMYEVFMVNDVEKDLWRILLPHVQYLLASKDVQKDDFHRSQLLSKCADALNLEGRDSEEETTLNELLLIMEGRLGEEDEYVQGITLRLASACRAQGRLEEAEQFELKVLETNKRKLGVDHPDTLKNMTQLIMIYRRQNRYEEAERLDMHVLKLYEIIYGNEDLETIVTISRLGMTYSYLEKWSEAEELLFLVLERRRSILGAHDGQTIAAMHNLAFVIYKQGRLTEAEKLETECLYCNMEEQGADHPKTLMYQDRLAEIWKAMGQDEKALLAMKDCAERRCRVLGITHWETQWSQETIAEWEAQDTVILTDGMAQIKL